MLVRFSLLEVFLTEMIVWLALWLINDYLATLLTVIITAILICVLLLALVSEYIERSKVPRKYFWVMAISIVCPILSGLFYLILFGGELSFMEGM
jgi:steroid 5-alpha reductase family enzyme